MDRFEIKAVSKLSKGEWAQVNGVWAEVLKCWTDPEGWTRISLRNWPIPETTMHKSVKVPWSPSQPAGTS